MAGDVTGDVVPKAVEGARVLSRSRNSLDFVLDWHLEGDLLGGRRTMHGLVLVGNLYAAAEFSEASGMGRPIIYTDASGQRHRAIALPREVSDVRPEYLPVRVAGLRALEKLLLPMMVIEPQGTAAGGAAEGVDGDGAGEEEARSNLARCQVLHTTMESAIAAEQLSGRREAILVIDSGRTIAISCGSSDLRRIRSALMAGQRAIRKAAYGRSVVAADDPASVSFSTLKSGARGSLSAPARAAFENLRVTRNSRAQTQGAVCLSFKTPQQAQRALELLHRFCGLEVYVVGEQRQMAREMLSALASERREELRRRMRESVGPGPTGPTGPAVPAQPVAAPVAPEEEPELERPGGHDHMHDSTPENQSMA
jgi:hypothetical protein